jgi:hypothetical protein
MYKITTVIIILGPEIPLDDFYGRTAGKRRE